MPAGRNATMQVGAQSDWSTVVAPTIVVPFRSESIRFETNTISPDTLTGRRTVDRMDVTGKKVEGSFEIVCYPDSLGILAAAALGAEASAAAVDGSAVYDHVITPMSAVTASSLPKMTIVVDRVQAVKGYVGCKINRMSFAAQVNDYLRATVDIRGYNETTDTLESLSATSRRPLQFIDGSVTVDETSYDEVRSLTLNVENDLEDNLFVLNGSDKMIEIEPQDRRFTLEMEVLYNSDTESTREDKYKTGTEIAIVATFTSSETVLTGKYYTATFTLPNCVITGDPSFHASGPGRMTGRFQVTALENGGESPLTVTIRDGQSTKHLIPA